MVQHYSIASNNVDADNLRVSLVVSYVIDICNILSRPYNLRHTPNFDRRMIVASIVALWITHQYSTITCGMCQTLKTLSRLVMFATLALRSRLQ